LSSSLNLMQKQSRRIKKIINKVKIFRFGFEGKIKQF
jgi:hypothetical protein